jgi:hypothetical protein
VLAGHAAAILAYTTKRFVTVEGGSACAPHPDGAAVFHARDATDYARFAVRYACSAGHGGAFVVRSAVSPTPRHGHRLQDDRDVRGRRPQRQRGPRRRASAVLHSAAWTARFAEFFLLGAEHLLTGIDHILFLLALIISSRRLRDVVELATCFTVAHSITFLLAALGLVHIGANVVEPAIALSIAAVAGWHLWEERLRRAARRRESRRRHRPDEPLSCASGSCSASASSTGSASRPR